MKKSVKVKPLECIVVSDKKEKTRIGEVHRIVQEDFCGKYQKKSTKIVFHDPDSVTKVGDVVTIRPSRPMSATKKFVFLEIKRKAKHSEVAKS